MAPLSPSGDSQPEPSRPSVFKRMMNAVMRPWEIILNKALPKVHIRPVTIPEELQSPETKELSRTSKNLFPSPTETETEHKLRDHFKPRQTIEPQEATKPLPAIGQSVDCFALKPGSQLPPQEPTIF